MVADLSLHFLRGMMELLSYLETSMVQNPASILPLIESTITAIYILLTLMLLLFQYTRTYRCRTSTSTTARTTGSPRTPPSPTHAPPSSKSPCLHIT